MANLFDTFEKNYNQTTYAAAQTQKLSEQMYDNVIEHVNGKIDTEYEKFYQENPDAEKTFALDMTTILGTNELDLDKLNSPKALAYMNSTLFTQYITGKNVFLTGFEQDADDPSRVKPMFAEYEQGSNARSGTPPKLRMSRPMDPTKEDGEVSFGFDEINRLHRDYVYNVKRSFDPMNVASTFNYMTSVGNKDGTVENVAVSKDVKDQELGPEGTGYGSDGDSSKRGWSGEPEWRKQAAEFLFNTFNKAPTIPDEIKTIDNLLEVDDEELLTLESKYPALQRFGLINTKNNAAKTKTRLSELKEEEKTLSGPDLDKNKNQQKLLEARLTRLQGKFNTEFAQDTGQPEEKSALSRALSGGLSSAVDAANAELATTKRRIDQQIKQDPFIQGKDRDIKNLEDRIPSLTGDAREQAEENLITLQAERNERENVLREKEGLAEKLTMPEIQGLLDNAIDLDNYSGKPYKEILRYIQKDKNIPVSLANRTAIRTLVEGITNRKKGTIDFSENVDKNANNSPAIRNGTPTAGGGEHSLRTPAARFAYRNATTNKAAVVMMNMIKSPNVSMTGKQLGTMLDTVRFTGTLSAPLLKAQIDAQFSDKQNKYISDTTKYLQGFIDDKIGNLSNLAQEAMGADPSDDSYKKYMNALNKLPLQIFNDIEVSRVLSNKKNPLNPELSRIIQRNQWAALAPILTVAGKQVSNAEEWFYNLIGRTQDLSKAFDPTRVNQYSIKSIYNGRALTSEEFANRFIAGTRRTKQDVSALDGFQLYGPDGEPVGQLIDREDIEKALEVGGATDTTGILRILETYGNLGTIQEEITAEFNRNGSIGYEFPVSSLPSTDALGRN